MSKPLCLTAEGRAKVRETCAKATQGPFHVSRTTINCYVEADDRGWIACIDIPYSDWPRRGPGDPCPDAVHNANWVATALNELPAALDKIEKLESALALIAHHGIKRGDALHTIDSMKRVARKALEP